MHDRADALRRNLIGGLLTTHNFVADAALWDAGIRHAFLDRQVFYHYTPIVNRSRWEALFDDERLWLIEAWEVTIDGMRRNAAERQARARASGEASGIEFVEPSREELRTMRKTLMEEQPALVKALEVDPALVQQAEAALDAADAR